MLKFIRMKQLRSFATTCIFRQHLSTKLDGIENALTNIYLTEAEVKEFKSVHNEIVDYLTNLDQFKGVKPLRDFCENMIEYNVKPSIIGLSLIDSYKRLANQADLTKENIKLANVLAWCSNAATGSCNIFDGLLDGSPVRRGKPAWHKLDNVGLEAANHGWMPEMSIHLVLSKYFTDTNRCKFLLEIFQECSFTACAGQMLENILIKDGKPQLELFTPELYRKLVYLKVGYPILRYHFTITCTLTNKYKKEHEIAVAAIAQKLGLALQSNNDFYGCFSNQREQEEGNMDISKGKCTWLVVEALQQANPAQKKIIENHYGRPGAEAEMAIRNVYLELELPKQHEQFSKEALNDCFETVKNHPDKDIRDILYMLEKMSHFLDLLRLYSTQDVKFGL